jgi:lipoprotein-anchoring transpeptidase ErfK/SrfK
LIPPVEADDDRKVEAIDDPPETSRRHWPGAAGRRLVALALVAAGTAGAVAVRGSPDSSPPATPGPAVPALAPAPAAAFEIGEPVPPGDGTHESRWAPVRRPVAARARPDRGARVVARLRTRTPERTTSIVLAIGRRQGDDGRIWVRVRLPVLPNGSTGWVPRSALGGYGTVLTRLVVDRSRLTATLLRAGRRVLTAPVGIGRAASPTPAGEFYVRNRVTRYRSAFYGPIAFGTSARSPTLTDWPGGGFVGIHGTNQPALIPGRVSHGCIRMRNADIRRLAREMLPGTPITIR